MFTSDIRSDKEITDLVIKTLKENWAVPNHRLTIIVKDGWVILKGILHWNFQRKTADEAIRYLNGVRGVIDEIKIEAAIKNEIEKEIVEADGIMDIFCFSSCILIKNKKNQRQSSKPLAF